MINADYDSMVFLSTPSARRATPPHTRHPAGRTYFYPRPPRGGQLIFDILFRAAASISIHALREEGNVFAKVLTPRASPISIHALREEGNQFSVDGVFFMVISIHALREEGNMVAALAHRPSMYFYPRPPRGGQP